MSLTAAVNLLQNQPAFWSGTSPDINPIKMLWNDLRRADHTRHPTNTVELKQFCGDEWPTIPPKHCARNAKRGLTSSVVLIALILFHQ